jgi:general secretion pathway protein C
MKRLPLFLTLLALVLLSSSIAHWVLELYQPSQRPLATAPATAMQEPSPDAAATLFGGQANAAVATNYQLTGVVAAGRNGVAIIVADGSPPKALPIGKEVAPGVTLSAVYPRYVMLSEGGVTKRIELATDTKGGLSLSGPAGGQAVGPGPAPQAMPEPQTAPGALLSPVPPEGAGRGGPGNPPPPPIQMPPPTRAVASPGMPPGQ